MKKIISLLLAVMLVISAVPMAYAADTQDYSLGTAVKYTAANNENYTITVPAKLAPGQGGTVTLDGYWASNTVVSVTAEENVVLTNSINANDQKTLDVSFDGISEAGDNSAKQTFTAPVSVAGISNALFGTWSGHFNYTVGSSEGSGGSTGGDSGNTEPSNPGGGSDELNPDDGSTPTDGDVYTAGDYKYTYRTAYSGWAVAINTEVTDTKQPSYGAILESVNGEPVTYMASTFRNCGSLTVAPAIPASVTNMKYTFADCGSLTVAPAIPASVTEMECTFQNCYQLTAAEIPAGITSLVSTFSNCSSLTTAPEIPDSVTDMSSTFRGCTGLTTAPEIPAGVTSLYCTFQGCENLTVAPEIPASVTNMSSTFYNCENLTVAPAIPASVTKMSSTFRGCTGLTTAPEIPAGVTEMEYTFMGCTGLTGEISIPCSLASKNYTYTDCPATITYYHIDGCDGSCGQ